MIGDEYVEKFYAQVRWSEYTILGHGVTPTFPTYKDAVAAAMALDWEFFTVEKVFTRV